MRFPESRNILNLIKYFSVYNILQERPTVLISAGAGIAIPFFNWEVSI